MRIALTFHSNERPAAQRLTLWRPVQHCRACYIHYRASSEYGCCRLHRKNATLAVVQANKNGGDGVDMFCRGSTASLTALHNIVSKNLVNRLGRTMRECESERAVDSKSRRVVISEAPAITPGPLLFA